jgi:hypothetical protein
LRLRGNDGTSCALGVSLPGQCDDRNCQQSIPGLAAD